MNKINSSSIPTLLENINPISDKWAIRWNVTEDPNNEGNFTYNEVIFDHKPSLDKIKSTILEYYNSLCDSEIISGFSFEGAAVWLSSENQFNYKAIYDLAFQTQGASLPVEFKFGTMEEPVYRVFTNIEELQQFYISSIQYVRIVLNKYWDLKDNIDWTKYEINTD